MNLIGAASDAASDADVRQYLAALVLQALGGDQALNLGGLRVLDKIKRCGNTVEACARLRCTLHPSLSEMRRA